MPNISLRNYNTFGIEQSAAEVRVVDREELLPELHREGLFRKPVFIIGGGSNILLTKNIVETVLVNQLKGIRTVREDAAHVWLEAASGESWHGMVLRSIEMGLGGIENLSLIPGTVGAAPMQNIGAYGVESGDTIETVHYFDLEEGAFKTIGAAECRFGYRDSIFKRELKGRVFITRVVFRLDRAHRLRTDYGAIRSELEAMGIANPGIRDVSDAVIRIRSSKLPDPKVTGNAGSFFKNPTVPKAQWEALRERYADLPGYEQDGGVKIPAGWLIEQAGWKGYREGDAGVHPKQALVIVNYGGAGGAELWALSERIVASVRERFGIELEREVQVW